MRFVRRTDRVVVGAVLAMLLPAWTALVGFDALIAFAAEFDEFGQGSYGFGQAMLAIACTLPRRAYQLFPPAALLGCLMGLGALAATSELTALRALGLSCRRICLGATMLLAILTLAMMIVAETLGPAGEHQSQALTLAAKSHDVAIARWSGLWARDGETFVNARQGRVEGEGARAFVTLDDVRLYGFEGARLAGLVLARRAEWRDGRWTLFDVRRTRFAARSAHTEKHASEPWPSSLDPAVLSLTVARPRYLSTRDLARGLEYQRRNGLDTALFESAYWARWFYPVNVLVLSLCAMPLAFGELRSGGAGKRLFIGAVLGLGYFMLQTLAVATAEVVQLDPRLGNLLPPLLLGGLAWAYYRQAK